MGYFIDLHITAQKAVHYTDLSGVKCIVFHEGESYSIDTLNTGTNGVAFSQVDRYHWQEEDTKRIKIYFEKAGYVKGCVKAVHEGSTTNNSGKLQSYTAHILLIEADPEPLPEPEIETSWKADIAVTVQDMQFDGIGDVVCKVCLPTSETPLVTFTTNSLGHATFQLPTQTGMAPTGLKILFEKPGYLAAWYFGQFTGYSMSNGTKLCSLGTIMSLAQE